jgi:Peptidase M50B-like
MLSMVVELEKPLPAPEVILIGLLAAVVVLVRALWEIAGPFETVVHESAHVIAGILTGRTIQGVRIEETGGGSTDMVPRSGCGYGVAAFVGYIGPSAAGLIAAGLISTGRMYAVLWLGLVLLAVMLVTIRNFFGGLVILMCGALLYLVVRYGTAEVETAFAYGVAWFLLISGIRVALRAAGRPKDVTDAEILAGMTFLFRWMWCLLWLAGTIAALWVGGRILIRGLWLGLMNSGMSRRHLCRSLEHGQRRRAVASRPGQLRAQVGELPFLPGHCRGVRLGQLCLELLVF